MHSFWEHLDELRTVILRCLAVWAVCAVALFCLREPLFDFLFTPAKSDFVLFQWLDWPLMSPRFINTQLAAQFVTHVRVAAWAGLVVSFPVLLWLIFRFVAPALYTNEKHATLRIMTFGTLLFFVGMAVNFLIVFPITFRFLYNYQVLPEVGNYIDLNSYISTLLTMSLLFGIVFEMPLVAWAMGKAGLVRAEQLQHYRRHAVVALTILAAAITPTGDAFTLLLVTLPLYGLYEISILLVKQNT